MKILFIPGGSPATVFGLVPLALSARICGHDVIMASVEDMMPHITGAGLPALSVSEHDIWHFIRTDRNGAPTAIPDDPDEEMLFTGAWFARMGLASMDTLWELSRDWRPDLVVGGSMSYAAPLFATRLGIPYVRQSWDANESFRMDDGANQELQPELRELGLDRLPEPDLRIEICPPSLTPPGSPEAKLMRWIPGNLQRPLQPWMWIRGGRRRVCVTSGSRATPEQNFTWLHSLAKQVAELDVEVVVPAPEKLAAELRAALPGVRTGWMPLDVVAPTCDLMIHHAGGATTMTALNSGVPQLFIPTGASFVKPANRIVDFGAAITIMPKKATADRVAQACEQLLTRSSYRERALALAAEIAALPVPFEMVPLLEQLVHDRTLRRDPR
jgi:glycosyltransferase